uniref:Uncharacterized protein n=1 Tax=Ciona savignyi TaxID=51511 RepID=H2Z3D8_CIOSA
MSPTTPQNHLNFSIAKLSTAQNNSIMDTDVPCKISTVPKSTRTSIDLTCNETIVDETELPFTKSQGNHGHTGVSLPASLGKGGHFIEMSCEVPSIAQTTQSVKFQHENVVHFNPIRVSPMVENDVVNVLGDVIERVVTSEDTRQLLGSMVSQVDCGNPQTNSSAVDEI